MTTNLDTISAAKAKNRQMHKELEKWKRLDAEAATHVESVICMRTRFTGNPPYVGWKGLGLALTEALDERDTLRSIIGDIGKLIGAATDGRKMAGSVAASAETALPAIGDHFGGGFFGGRITIDGSTYALIVAPKDAGQEVLPWKVRYTDTPGARSLNDGWANTAAMNDYLHPAAAFCRSLNIAGHADWYLPSRDELEVCYRNLRPTERENFIYPSRIKRWRIKPGEYNGVDDNGNGHNGWSLPSGEAYTADSPAQTAVEAFRQGDPEAFDQGWYWSSTEFSHGYAWVQLFDDGHQDNGGKNDDLHCRAVRKVLIEDGKP